MAAGQSPASSPRLPSPPPMAEDQVGPTSPGISLYEDHGKLPGAGGFESGASRRIRPGTRAEDMAEGPPLVELHDIDSAFPLTEHLKALHYSQTHPEDSPTTTPITSDIAKLLATPPPSTSKDIWLYELGRFLIQKTNLIIVGLFADSPPCSAQTCPEMRASEWQYLCAVHDPPKSCSAIDYCCHTLDSAATTLSSSKTFPSRLGLGSGSGGFAAGGPDKVLQQQMKELTNIFRRVYRIYAHAWFQHRDMFWRVESKTGLYIFFKTVCDAYGLIQPENYTIPPEAEGLDATAEESDARLASSYSAPILLKREPADSAPPQAPEPAGGADKVVAGGETTKRHRHTMSGNVNSVTHVIQEEVEEEDEEAPGKPPLDRKATTIKPELAESETVAEAPVQETSTATVDPTLNESQSSEHQQNSKDAAIPLVPGIERSDTLKPTLPVEAAKGADEDGSQSEGDDSDVNVTTVEISADEDGSTEPPLETAAPASTQVEDIGKAVTE